jgi:hypothetical protein
MDPEPEICIVFHLDSVKNSTLFPLNYTKDRKGFFLKGTIVFALIIVSFSNFAQDAGKKHIGGTITATSNGISIIPSFSLGRPAVFFDLSMGGERLSFDPMIRFGMDGKPWSFILWGRYKVIKDKRFSLSIGGHPAFLFQEKEMIVDGKQEKLFVANRYLAGEINTDFKVTEKFSVGLYYLRGAGVQVISAKNSDFLALNVGLPEIKFPKDIRLTINPQFFFLQVDENSGYYANAALTVKKGDLPFQFQTFFNHKIKSTIPSDDLVWNVSLMYKFNSTFSKK